MLWVLRVCLWVLLWATLLCRQGFGIIETKWQIELARTVDPNIGHELRVLIPNDFYFWEQQNNYCYAEISVSIIVRSAMMQALYADERSETSTYALSQSNPKFFFFRFWIPPTLGGNTIEIFIENPVTRRHILWQSEYSLPAHSKIETSSPMFLNSETQTPILSKYFPVDVKILQVEIAAQGIISKPVVLQQTLLKRDNTTSNPDAVAYVPVEYQSHVVRPTTKKQTMNQKITLTNLDPGEYLVQWIWFADDQVIGESSKSFILPWNGINQIFENIDDAIEQLIYCTTNKEIQTLLQIPNKELKQNEFIHFWEKQPVYQEPVYLKIGKYYQQIKLAKEKFGSWQNDQSRIFFQLGLPQQIKYTGKKLYWHYPELNLSIGFHQEKGIWKVDPI